MSVRPFQDSDFLQVSAIYADSKLDELRFEKQAYEFLPLEQDKKRFVSLMESDIYVYDDNGVSAYLAIFESEIRSIFVHSSARGLGIGTTLLEFALSKIEGSVSLNVAKSNQAAKDLYTKYGFKIIEEFTSSYNGVEAIAEKMIRTQTY